MEGPGTGIIANRFWLHSAPIVDHPSDKDLQCERGTFQETVLA